MELGIEGLINLNDKPVELDSNWWMNPYDTWRITVTATFTQGSGVESATEPSYVGLATDGQDLAFGIGVDSGQFSLLEPNNKPTGAVATSRYDVGVAYDLNTSYDMTMTVCSDPTGQYRLTSEFKRAGISVAKANSSASSTSKIPTTEPLTRLTADVGPSGSVRFEHVELYRVSTDGSSCLSS